jgi:O-antigen/teichoic acid export membrane protein
MLTENPEVAPTTPVPAADAGPRPHLLSNYVARGAFGMFLLKVAYSGLAFGLGLILARAMGPAGLGAYNYALSWAVFLAVPAALGLDKLVVREVAVYRDRSDWVHLRGLLRTSNRAVVGASATIVALAAAAGLAAGEAWSGAFIGPFLAGLLMVPILTLMKVRQAALAGLREVVRGQWPELLVHPLFLSLLLVGTRLVASQPLTPTLAMGLTVFSAALVLALGAWLLHRSMPVAALRARPEPTVLPWRHSIVPLVAMGSLQMLHSQVDTLLLGALTDPRSVGIYSTAYRGALLVSFFLMAAAPAFGPAAASLHAARDIPALQRLTAGMARTTFLLSLPVALALAAFGRWYLLLYGPQFVEGAGVLVMLVGGQLVNVACGPVGIVMMMTGQERIAVRVIAVAAATNFVVGMLLIPRLGIYGAAVGATASMVLWNVLLVREARRRVGVDCTVLGRIP